MIGTRKIAHFRLSYSRQMFVIAYPRESQEMVLDANDQAFAFFGGVPKRMVYDNLKTAAIVLNQMRSLTEKSQPKTLKDTPTPTHINSLEPLADCSRYNSLRGLRHDH